MEPEIVFAADGGELGKVVDCSSADGACGAYDEEGFVAGCDVAAELFSEGGGVDLKLIVGRDPADRVGAETGEVGGLLNPGMSFFGAVDSKASAVHAFGAYVPACFGLAGGEEADEVGHVAAADKEASAVGGIAEHLGDPADGLGFDLACHGREWPGSDVGVDGCSEEFGENADGGGRTGDVSPEARVAVEERVVEEEIGCLIEKRCGVGALLRDRAVGVEGLPDCSWCFGGSDEALRKRVQQRRDLVDELMSESLKLAGTHGERRCASVCCFQIFNYFFDVHGDPR